MNRQESTSAPGHDDIPEPAFGQNRFLGNIGAPVDHDWWNTQFEGEGAVDDEVITPAGSNGITTLIPVVSIV